MKKANQADQTPTSTYDSIKVLEMLTDPTRLGIFLHIFLHPGSSSLEVKKKMNIPGSGIYYHINQLIDTKIVEPTEIEEVSTHLSRRRFQVAQWVVDVLEGFHSQFHQDEEKRNQKAFLLFQMYFMMTILNQQARILESIPDSELDEYVKTIGLPEELFFCVDREDIPIILSKNEEIFKEVEKRRKQPHSVLDIIRDSSHVTFFGAYPFD